MVFERETVTKPGLPIAIYDHPTSRCPKPGDAPFSKTPIARDYATRRRMYLDWVAQRATPHDRGGVLNDMVKFAAGICKAITPAALDEALAFVNARHDPSDFTVAGLVRLYALHKDTGFLTPAQVEEVRAALLRYKYTLDEPGESETEMWTENHQILSHGSDYLAGQLFPDEKFMNDGRSGTQHRDKARSIVLRWLKFRARTGPAEWDSVPYYNMDLGALLNLVEFAQDLEIQARASMMVDLLLFDAAVNSFYGQMGTSHGRAYAGNVLDASGDSLLNIQTLLFGHGRLQSVDLASTMLVTGERYTLPSVLEAIANDMPEEILNYERHSIPLSAEAAKEYGFSLTDIKDFEIWWGMGAFSQPEVINLTFDTVEKYNLWNYREFKPLKTIGRILRPLGLLPLASRMLNPDSNGTLISQVDKLTYRTPDAMLSTAQDYRRGEKGYEQHIWQATLGPYAVVFVTHPGSPGQDGKPGYWTSNNRLPRNAQYRDVLISIYKLPQHGVQSQLEVRPYGATHAYFPKWSFDETVEVPSVTGGGWIFGRVADGYIGLYSHFPYQWTNSGPEAGQEIVVYGVNHIWICQVGRKALHGNFSSFVSGLSRASIQVNNLRVNYASPGNGMIEFDWDGPLTVDGTEVTLRNYPRWNNKYTRMEFGSEKFHVEFEGKTLNLDLANGIRTQE